MHHLTVSSFFNTFSLFYAMRGKIIQYSFSTFWSKRIALQSLLYQRFVLSYQFSVIPNHLKNFNPRRSELRNRGRNKAEMRVECPECKKTYAGNHILKMHMRTVHVDSKQEKSAAEYEVLLNTQCNKKFKYNRDLTIHIARLHAPATRVLYIQARIKKNSFFFSMWTEIVRRARVHTINQWEVAK